MGKYEKYLDKLNGGAGITVNVQIVFNKVEYDTKPYIVDKDFVDKSDDGTIMRNDNLSTEILKLFAYANNIIIQNKDENEMYNDYKFEWLDNNKLKITSKKDYNVIINNYDTMAQEITSTTTEIVHAFKFSCDDLMKTNILTKYTMFNFDNCEKRKKNIIVTLNNNIVIDSIRNLQYVSMKQQHYYTLKLSFTNELDRFIFVKKNREVYSRKLRNTFRSLMFVAAEKHGDDDNNDNDRVKHDSNLIEEYNDMLDDKDLDIDKLENYTQLNKKLNDENMAIFFNKIYDNDLLKKIYDKLMILINSKNKFKIFRSKTISEKLGLPTLCDNIGQIGLHISKIDYQLSNINKNNEMMKENINATLNANGYIKNLNKFISNYKLINIENLRNDLVGKSVDDVDGATRVETMMTDIKTFYDTKENLKNGISEHNNTVINERVYEEIIWGYNLIKLYIAIVNYLLEENKTSIYNKIIIDDYDKYDDLVTNMNSI